MSKELEKLNIISIVQKLKEDDVIILQKYIENLEKENQKYKEDLKQKEDIIDKVIKWIENDYYLMNTIDIDSIVITNNKLLLIRRFLKGDK